MIDVRCDAGESFGNLDEQGRLEVRCSRCRDAIRKVYGERVVVFHYIGPAGIEDTKIYGDPAALTITENHVMEAARQLGWRIAK